MRLFDEQIFLGSGEYSEKSVKLLKARLREGVMLLGGIQQPLTCHESEEAWRIKREQDRQSIADLEEIVRDVAMALTGSEIEFVQEPDPTTA